MRVIFGINSKRMKTMQQWLDAYAESHQHPSNKLIHWICVPLIFFSIVCLLLEVRIAGSFSLATIAMLFVLIFYIRLSRSLAAGMLIFYVLCLMLARFWLLLTGIPLWILAVSVFIPAWIGQFIGHGIEGKKPSFLQDMKFLLIGPAWLMAKIYRRLGIPI